MAKDDDEKTVNEAIGVVVTTFVNLALIPVICIFNAVVVFKYWYWFVVPVFGTAPHPTILQCYGLLLTVGLFRMKIRGRGKTEEEKAVEWGPWKTTFVTLVALGFALGFGWLIQLLVVGNPNWANTFLGM